MPPNQFRNARYGVVGINSRFTCRLICRQLSFEMTVSHPSSHCIATPPTGPAFDAGTLVQHIRDAIDEPIPSPASPLFQFELTDEAANHNWTILKDTFGRSMSRAIAGQANTPLSMGSEFRPACVLEPLLGQHPLWHRIRSLLTVGSIWALDPIDNTERLQGVMDNIERGNHKSARDRPDVLRQQIIDDVTHGFALPLPTTCIPMIPHAEVAPMGLVAQNTINARGEIVPKDRLTHDQSFEVGQAPSVNNRVRMEEHQDVLFGHALRRLIHFIVETRRRHPTTPILLQKVDFKAAYRRAHLAPDLAVKCITTLGGLALMMLRLTFGGRPCPSEWCNISETVADLSRALLACKDWDPATLHSPQQKHVGDPVLLDEAVPFAKAREMIVQLPGSDNDGAVEPYIDDIITAMLDTPLNRQRIAAATLLAIHSISRPVSDDEPLPRDDMASIKKLLAEGTPAEVACLLGWDADTRRLLLSLPHDKFLAWSKDMQRLLQHGKATRAELDTLVGRLNHVGYIIPAARHFLSRIRDLLQLAKNAGVQPFDTECIADLHLWLKFLQQASNGINMNLLTYRQPTVEYLSDACEHGIGGYSSAGKAWRWALPQEIEGRFTLNFLEFVAAIIGPWMDHLQGELPPLSCILSGTDSTTAEGWLRKTNFSASSDTREEIAVKLAAARQLATVLIESKSMLYSQWFQGKLNIEADSLSRDTHLTDDELTHLLTSSPACQLPPNFRIVPLPNEITSWLISLARSLPVRKQLQRPLTRSTLSLGSAGKHSSSPSESTATPFLTPSTQHTAQSSSAPLPTPCERPPFRGQSYKSWLLRQSEIPYHLYVRPSDRTNGQIQAKTGPVTLHSFYHGN